ncbi:hypothetical protein G9A89_004340 [Geosiphon pyriformis]|nr:hypothetical protein G9A89_004340 [Geosiphon pyriformis]
MYNYFVVKATVGPSIAVIKKVFKDSGFGADIKPVVARKKRRGDALKDNFETGNTIESNNVDIEKKCLVKETSFDYDEDRTLTERNMDQTPKSSKILTKRVLRKPLRKINFLCDNSNNILLDTPLTLLFLLKILVDILVKKSFVLDIDLNKMIRRFFQKKLVTVRKLFSKINGFKGGVIFTSESSLTQATEKAEAVNMVAVVLKEIPIGTLAEAVCAAISEFDFIGSVGGKTCVTNQHLIMYVQARCAVVCFDSTDSLNAVIDTTFVLRSSNLCWSHLSSAKYAKYRKLGHTFLSCSIDEKLSLGGPSCRILLDNDKSRLVSIYVRHFTPIFYLVSFGNVSWAKIVGELFFFSLSAHNDSAVLGSSLKMKPVLMVSIDLDNRFAALEHSFVSLVEYINKLAKKLNTLGSMNQGVDIVISEDSGMATGDETIVRVAVFDSSVVSKIKDILNNLSIMIMSLSAKMDNTGLSINVSAKQEDVVYWHMESENMIMNKFNGVKIFSSGLDKEFLGAGVAIIMNNSLAHHVSKIKEVSNHLIFVQLLFKSKLLLVILSLYAGASAKTRFSQSSEINFFIAKAVNSSIFMVLGGDFNENGFRKNMSFKFYSDLDLVNSFNGYLLAKASTWSNSKGVMKVINYIFVSRSLFSAVASYKVVLVSEFFNTNYNVVLVLVGLGGFLNAHFNSNHIQTSKDK